MKRLRQKLNILSWPKILRDAQCRFGIKGFRPGQKEVLAAVLSGRSTLAVMPTGAGKSLTYQLPALYLPKPVLVVSPLISLMQDQQDKAEQASLEVEKLNSTNTKRQAEAAAKEIDDHVAQLIYVTPERLQDHTFIDKLNAAGGISLLVVDEAHTIPQWGHDFRPAFLSIGNARKSLGDPPVLALTATATTEIANEILHSLRAEDAIQIQTGIERENLFFSVYPTVSNEAKLARISDMLSHEEGTGIIYTASVRAADELYDYLTDHGISAAHYHGKMRIRDRELIQQEFMRGDHKVMIATKAFGLGIDKPDIRFVYHYEFPDSIETYYQEAGRAGRDGQSAHAVLLYRLEDKKIQTFFMAGRYPKTNDLEAIYQVLAKGNLIDGQLAQELADKAGISERRTRVILHLMFEAGVIEKMGNAYRRKDSVAPSLETLEKLLVTYTERAASDKARLAEMMHYAESTNCRFQLIRTYFDEPAGEPCFHCDNCARIHDEERRGIIDDNKTNVKSPVEGGASSFPRQYVHILTSVDKTETSPSESTIQTSLASDFHVGDEVCHNTFGSGEVLSIEDKTATVSFSDVGTKRLKVEFLSSPPKNLAGYAVVIDGQDSSRKD